MNESTLFQAPLLLSGNLARVKGFPGYFVDTLGNVYNKKGKLLKPHPRGSRNGAYLSVSLWIDGVRTNKYVHRLVAEHFLPRIPGKEYVNHIIKDRENNSIYNLEWVTHSENMLHCLNYSQA